jgi:signal peptidase II
MPEENFKTNFLKKENIFSLVLLLIIFSVDRFTKIRIINSQAVENTIFINDFLNYELVWNTGIGFGLFSLEANITYHIVTFIIFILILFLFFLTIKSKGTEKFLYTFIMGGALGNFYDRCTFYAVPDFIDLHVSDFHWFTFNIADIFISIGIILIILKEISMKKT